MVGASKVVILVESESRVSMINTNDNLVRAPVGTGDFACCTRNHIVEVDGQPRQISCDRTKVAAVLSKLVNSQLERLSQLKDLSEYRLILAHDHIIFKGLPNECDRPKYNTWAEFAKAFHFNVAKPLSKVGGMHNCTPILYAVMANNFPIVKHLIESKANVNATFGKGARTYYGQFTPLHMNMLIGHGDAGKQIFDILLDSKADPYKYSAGGSSFRKPTFRDPFTCGVAMFNTEMVLHYIKRVKPNFDARADRWQLQEMNVVSKCEYQIVEECVKQGVTFQQRTAVGVGALGTFCLTPKQYQPGTDCRILDLLHEHNLLGDLNAAIHGNAGLAVLGFKVLWHARNGGLLKNHGIASLLYGISGGSYLHGAVYRDKPEIVTWLVNHGADRQRTNWRGLTPLELAQELGHERCVAVLLGNKSALRRYSSY